MPPLLRRPDIAYIPTPYDALDAMLALAELTPADLVYDLGSGDGRCVIAAAQRWGCRGVGIDIDPARITQGIAAAEAAGVRHLVDFRLQDLYTCDLQAATVVCLYLLPHLNLRLRPHLWHQLSAGSRVISHQFDMGDWVPDTVLTLADSEEESTIYRWRIP